MKKANAKVTIMMMMTMMMMINERSRGTVARGPSLVLFLRSFSSVSVRTVLEPGQAITGVGVTAVGLHLTDTVIL